MFCLWKRCSHNALHRRRVGSNSDVKVICIRGIGGSDDYCLTAVATVILATMVIV